MSNGGTKTMSTPSSAEDEANKCIVALCCSAPYHSVSEVLNSLMDFQRSSDEHERKTIPYIIKMISDDVRYFPGYPLWVVEKFALLFGGIIVRDLISNDTDLCSAQTVILDALNKKPGSKIFHFGLIALKRIKRVLFKYRDFCSQIELISVFSDLPEDLIKHVNCGKNGKKTLLFRLNITDCQEYNTYITTTGKTKPAVPAKPPKSIISTGGAVGCYEDYAITDSVSDEKPPAPVQEPSWHNEGDLMITLPPTNVRDRVATIFNSMSLKNVQKECAEIKKHLTREYLPWLAQYMVSRITNTRYESHSLYDACLVCFNSDPLNDLLEKETVNNIKILSKISERSSKSKFLLINLGHWLGLLTLARNKPVQVIDLGDIIVKSHLKGIQELEIAVPFVVKVLESSKESKEFGPKSPWVTAVLILLANLQRNSSLTVELWFEVERLFKSLNVPF